MWRNLKRHVIRSEISKLDRYLRGEMITDHAGEIGAVSIYYGAKHSLLWKQYFIEDKAMIAQLSRFVNHHMIAEKEHLLFYNTLMPKELHTNLIPFWKLSGYVLGYFSMSVSPNFFFKTIEYVEDFVVKHYMTQINYIDSNNIDTPNLKNILQSFCDDEDEHRKQGLAGANNILDDESNEFPNWKWIVQSGSVHATTISKYFKGYMI